MRSTIQVIQDNEVRSFPNDRAGDFRKWFNTLAEDFTTADVDVELSQKISKRVGAELKECYRNCFRAIPYGYDYYEGYYLHHSIGVPFGHAWMTNGIKIIDPTAVIEVENLPLRNRIGNEYRGIKLPTDFVSKLAFSKRISGPFLLEYMKLKQGEKVYD